MPPLSASHRSPPIPHATTLRIPPLSAHPACHRSPMAPCSCVPSSLLTSLRDARRRARPVCAAAACVRVRATEPVLQLSWTRDPQRSLTSSADSSFVLVSVGADGKLLMWSPSNSLATPVNGFVLSAAFFSFQDKDGDGQITAEEVLAPDNGRTSPPPLPHLSRSPSLLPDHPRAGAARTAGGDDGEPRGRCHHLLFGRGPHHLRRRPRGWPDLQGTHAPMHAMHALHATHARRPRPTHAAAIGGCELARAWWEGASGSCQVGGWESVHMTAL
jgi:hypothetical protein